jgi:hypothetical protein
VDRTVAEVGVERRRQRLGVVNQQAAQCFEMGPPIARRRIGMAAESRALQLEDPSAGAHAAMVARSLRL